jgi:hypothetical protein
VHAKIALVIVQDGSPAFVSPSVNQIAPQERRAAPRKPLRRPITLTLPDGATLQGQTIDLTDGGLRAAIPRLLAAPVECTFSVALMIDGKPLALNGTGRILSCVCTGMTFSIGIQFKQLDAAAKAAIAAALR